MGALTDIADAVRGVGLGALEAAQLPDVLESFHHHTPFVPQTSCCKGVTDEDRGTANGFLTTHITRGFAATAFPAARSAAQDADTPSRPAIDIWLRLWRCFTMLDSEGRYNIAVATTKSEGLADDHEVLWTGLQLGACNDQLATYGCRSVVLWESKPIRIQAGCAGWDFHLSGMWQPVTFPPEGP